MPRRSSSPGRLSGDRWLLLGILCTVIMSLSWVGASAETVHATSQVNNVTVRLHLKNIARVNEPEESMQVAFTVQLRWVDSQVENVTDSVGKIVSSDSIWMPDIYISNGGKEVFVKQDVARILPNQVVELHRRYYADVELSMKYHWFPFDMHTWFIHIQSLSYPAEQLQFVPGGVFRDETLDHPLWDIVNVSNIVGNHTAFNGQVYSRYTARIFVDRYEASYIWQIILPSVFVVMFAWSSFYVDPSIVPARMALTVMSVMIILFLDFKVSSMLPLIAYSTWMDVYMLVCFLMTSVAVIVFIYIVYSKNSAKASSADSAPACPVDKVDEYARFIFLGVFLVFNIAMFSTALSHTSSASAAAATMNS